MKKYSDGAKSASHLLCSVDYAVSKLPAPVVATISGSVQRFLAEISDGAYFIISGNYAADSYYVIAHLKCQRRRAATSIAAEYDFAGQSTAPSAITHHLAMPGGHDDRSPRHERPKGERADCRAERATTEDGPRHCHDILLFSSQRHILASMYAYRTPVAAR